MKTSGHHLGRWLPMIVGLCLASFALGAPCRVLFEELFEGPPDSGWYWIRGDAEKRRVENGTLSLFLEPGGSYADRDPPLRLQMVLESGGEPIVPHHLAYSSDRVTLGMRIGGGDVIGLFRSSENEPWKTLGRMELPPWEDLAIGLEASYGVPGADRWAQFDNFRISSD